MLIVQVCEVHFLICLGRDHLDLTRFPALFNALSQLWKCFIIGGSPSQASVFLLTVLYILYANEKRVTPFQPWGDAK